MKYILLLSACLLLLTTRAGNAHPQGTPHVELNITLDEKELVFDVVVPSFAVPALSGVDRGNPASELYLYKEGVERFIKENCPVTIDGIAVRPVLRSIAFRNPRRKTSTPGELGAEDLGEDPQDLGSPRDESRADSSDDGLGPPVDQPAIPLWLDTHLKLVYSTKGKPRQVSIVWKLFAGEAMKKSDLFFLDLKPSSVDASNGGTDQPSNPNEVIAILDVFGVKGFATFTPTEPQHVWHSEDRLKRERPMVVLPAVFADPLKLPLVPVIALVAAAVFLLVAWVCKLTWRLKLAFMVIALIVSVGGWNVSHVEIASPGAGGVKIPEVAERKDIFEALHRNVYRAFDYQTEDDIYDALEQSVSGALLDDIYNDVFQGLILRDEGGAMCKIEKVEILRSETKDVAADVDRENLDFKISCRWRVTGLVEHWGHAHRRVNEYSAVYTLMPFGDAWKIADVEMDDQKRVKKNSG
jgi:hypothetical protein